MGGRRVFIKNGQSLDDAMRESGKFGTVTSAAERQQKIDSVHIDFETDNTLPGLNREDLEELGKEDKPVLLKKTVIDKNLTRHPEIPQEDYKTLIAQSLYRPDLVTPGHSDKPYFHFVSRVGDNKSTIVLLELSETKDNYEIVNLHWSYNRQRETIERKGEKIKDQSK